MADINDVLSLRYDGKDADKHEIDLFLLGVSLQGFGRIASCAGTFALTNNYSKYLRHQAVRVAARESKANCFSLELVWNFAAQHQLFSGAFGVIVAAIIGVAFASATRRKDEARQMWDIVNKTLDLTSQNQVTNSRFQALLERMVTELRPAVRQTLDPIGRSCKTLSIKVGKSTFKYDEADRAAADLSANDEITEILDFSILITELDLERTTGKAYLDHSAPKNRRIPITIMDPQVQAQNNPYATAFAAGAYITVKAKGLIKDGKLTRLFVSYME